MRALLLLACAPGLPEEALPEAVVAEGVVAGGAAGGLAAGPQWGLAAVAVELAAAGGEVRAEAPAVVAEAAGGGAPITIRSTRAEWRLRDRRARFEGAVVMRRGGMELRCTVLEVQYGAGGEIVAMEAAGPVEVEQGERRARGARATYDAARDEIVLTGSRELGPPVLEEGGSRLRGAVVRVRVGAEEVICEGAGEEVCVLELAGR